jgi:hypothetical protein
MNPKAMDEKISLAKLYITQPTSKEETKHFNSKFKEEENQQYNEKSTIIKLFNKATTIEIVNTTNEQQQKGLHYYVNMPHSHVATQDHK